MPRCDPMEGDAAEARAEEARRKSRAVNALVLSHESTSGDFEDRVYAKQWFGRSERLVAALLPSGRVTETQH